MPLLAVWIANLICKDRLININENKYFVLLLIFFVASLFLFDNDRDMHC